MALVFTIHDTLQIREPFFSIISFLPGILSLGALSVAGFTRRECNLIIARLSKPGLFVLAGTSLLLLPILLSSSGAAGWNWLAGLVYAPASGIAQELYFRACLLPALLRLFHGRTWPALCVHSLIFVGYHLRTFRSITSIQLCIMVGAVLFLAGVGWGRQSQMDRTVAWTTLHHSVFLTLMSVFTWGSP